MYFRVLQSSRVSLVSSLFTNSESSGEVGLNKHRLRTELRSMDPRTSYGSNHTPNINSSQNPRARPRSTRAHSGLPTECPALLCTGSSVRSGDVGVVH